jgi:type I restriction enzyme S subunit
MSLHTPEGWASARVEELFDWWGGMTPSTTVQAYWGGGLPWVSSKDLKSYRLNAELEMVTEKALRETRLRKCRPGTLLIVVRSGVLTHTLPVAIANRELVINQDLKAFDSGDDDVNRWFATYLRANEQEILDANRKDGTTVQSIRVEQLIQRIVPVPPIAEQRRVVEKAEALLARVNTVRVRLIHVSRILQRFRQAVLTAAFRDGLIGLPKGRDDVPAEVAAVATGFSEQGWPLVRAEQACSVVQSGSTPTGRPFSAAGDIPFLKVYNVVDHHIDFDYKPQFVSRTVHNGELRRSVVRPGDVLMNIVGPPLGKIAIVPETYPEWNINQALVLFRPNGFLEPRFLYYFLREGSAIRELAPDYRGSAGQSNISLSQSRDLLVPVPNIQCQRALIGTVGRLFRLADAVEEHIKGALARAESTSKAILCRAFAGRLVPTEAELAAVDGRSYETSQELLDRIRLAQEEAVREKTPPLGRRRTRTALKRRTRSR